MRRTRTLPLALLTAAVGGSLLLTGCQAASPAPDTSASAPSVTAPAGADGYGLVAGEGPITVQLWTDLSCPYCAMLEADTGAVLADAVDAGEITLTIHPLNFVSEKHGDETDWSTRGANALAAIADAGEADRMPALYALLQEHQSLSDGSHPTDEDILDLIAEAGVTADVSDAVTTQRFGGWVDASNEHWLGTTIDGTTQVVSGVPILVVDGEVFEIAESGNGARLQQLLAAAS